MSRHLVGLGCACRVQLDGPSKPSDATLRHYLLNFPCPDRKGQFCDRPSHGQPLADAPSDDVSTSPSEANPPSRLPGFLGKIVEFGLRDDGLVGWSISQL